MSNEDLQDALLTAVRCDDMARVKRLLAGYRNEIDINQPDRYGELAIHTAVFNFNDEMINYLIQQGANLKLRDKRFGHSVTDTFMRAMYNSYDEKMYKTLRILQRVGTDFDSPSLNDFSDDIKQGTTLNMHLRNCFIILIIFEFNKDRHAVLFYLQKLQDILDINQPANWNYLNNEPALAWAVRICSFEIIKFIIEECKASVLIKNAQGKTLIELAQERKKQTNYPDLEQENNKILQYIQACISSATNYEASKASAPQLSNRNETIQLPAISGSTSMAEATRTSVLLSKPSISGLFTIAKKDKGKEKYLAEDDSELMLTPIEMAFIQEGFIQNQEATPVDKEAAEIQAYYKEQLASGPKAYPVNPDYVLTLADMEESDEEWAYEMNEDLSSEDTSEDDTPNLTM